MANTWHGRFPYQNLAPHGFTRTSPVSKFRPNGYDLYDVTGNVWEWTDTDWTHRHPAEELGPGQDGQQLTEAACCAPRTALSEHDRFVIKGGSHLCAPSYCHRYRPAARQPHGPCDTTSHVGFRCVQSRRPTRERRVLPAEKVTWPDEAAGDGSYSRGGSPEGSSRPTAIASRRRGRVWVERSGLPTSAVAAARWASGLRCAGAPGMVSAGSQQLSGLPCRAEVAQRCMTP
jgi:hypothetical protein